eukprot:CAMPEP_0117572930 /NCGR_PEP_ID=MMETSP0784-20121206/60640_1 /TAXON_ID=39447 /ORGANISM="" /LENGTH=124 /DNA_ID=CAMNT_0005371375 /DNA_START=491 /DNA_END=865 /DNA_ORIENTATION=+
MSIEAAGFNCATVSLSSTSSVNFLPSPDSVAWHAWQDHLEHGAVGSSGVSSGSPQTSHHSLRRKSVPLQRSHEQSKPRRSFISFCLSGVGSNSSCQSKQYEKVTIDDASMSTNAVYIKRPDMFL